MMGIDFVNFVSSQINFLANKKMLERNSARGPEGSAAAVASPSFLFSGFPGIYKTDVCVTVHTAHTHTVRVYNYTC
jgi:hypothetical protein